MNIDSDLSIKVSCIIRYDEGERPRTEASYSGKAAEWDVISGSATVDDDGLLRSTSWTGRGVYIKANGQAGSATANMGYGSMDALPMDVRAMLVGALIAQAERVTVAELVTT